MNKKEMIDNFGFDRKTLNNWENGEKPKRALLYRTLEALPFAFVENVEKQMSDAKNNEKLLERKG